MHLLHFIDKILLDTRFVFFYAYYYAYFYYCLPPKLCFFYIYIYFYVTYATQVLVIQFLLPVRSKILCGLMTLSWFLYQTN